MKEALQVYDDSRKLSYAELKGSPAGIDLTKKEVCLTLIKRTTLMHACLMLTTRTSDVFS